MLHLADLGFFLFHTLLIGFNMFGWIWPRTRVLHLICISLTAFSWFVMGAFYGWGYCLCTDWHFQVREQLSYEVDEETYIQLIASEGFGITMSRTTSDFWAVAVFALILIATGIVWYRDLKRKKLHAPHGNSPRPSSSRA